MILLNPDPTFHFEVLRILALASYSGSSIGEVLQAASHVSPGDFESFYTAFSTLASRVHAQAKQINTTLHPISARETFFRASTYYRAADFFLHGNPSDPRIQDLWTKQTSAFDQAIALLPVPGERVRLPAEGFDVSAIYFRASSTDNNKPRATIILGNGYDGAQEEMMHVAGFAALERGYNVIVYEGPGQPTVMREQGCGFTRAWENVVTPVVDFLVRRPEVDAGRIGLLGFSLGGYLAVRAAAFEGRIAAVMAIDGVWDVYQALVSNVLPPAWGEAHKNGQVDVLSDELRKVLDGKDVSTTVRWAVEHGLWCFGVDTAKKFLDRVKDMTMEGLEDRVRCPVFVGKAADEHFFQGQPELVDRKLGGRGTLVTFTAEEGAGQHCHLEALPLMNQRVLDWFQDVVEGRIGE
ncbi:alpha/beta-hydrolase [Aspergillus ellipticus CBS 707.79]|uniref:Alpha/beta-hydrolase n=1 Tax=Aspergillus ellipticus CBS 707.79 TaxID=1448320 RepID=A0A319E030_9EURO|nr:alpha/beta-hydrolase [Aspergillus ellipticus CBS 707.79]